MTNAAGSSSALQNRFRTHYCGSLGPVLQQEKVSLAGWVHRIRDHGGLVFIDLRDHTGICQLVIQPEEKELFEQLRICTPSRLLPLRAVWFSDLPKQSTPALHRVQ